MIHLLIKFTKNYKFHIRLWNSSVKEGPFKKKRSFQYFIMPFLNVVIV